MIVGFHHPLTGRVMPLWDESMSTLLPLGMWQSMVQREQADERHQGVNITATSALGCPRALVLSRFTDTHPNPLRMWSTWCGTGLHQWFAHACAQEVRDGREVWFTEELHPTQCTFEGE